MVKFEFLYFPEKMLIIVKVDSHDPISGASYDSNSKKPVTQMKFLWGETMPEK